MRTFPKDAALYITGAPKAFKGKVLIGNGGTFPAVTIPNELGMHTLTVEFRDWTGNTVIKTLYQKIWDRHVVEELPDGTALLYVDRHLVHEVTSPQAFEGLRNHGRKLRRPQATLAVADHNVPTTDRHLGIVDPVSRLQVEQIIGDTIEADIPIRTLIEELQRSAQTG